MIRHFEALDLDACVQLFVSTFAGPPWSETWDPQVVRARLDQIIRTPQSFGVVILDAGEIAGFAIGIAEPWHEGTHFYLKEMCIAHGKQRQGFGSQLMDSLLRDLRDRGTQRVYLLTARGDMSEAFYSKAGFYTSPKMILMARHIEKR